MPGLMPVSEVYDLKIRPNRLVIAYHHNQK